MKQFVYIICFIFCSIANIYGQDVKFLKEIGNNFVRLNDKLFAYKYETTNAQYLMFLSEKQHKDIDKLGICVDTTNWNNRHSEKITSPLTELYLPHPAYANFPVVNVRYEGAVEFCKWLTEKYNSNPKRKFKKVEMRLPSPEEWETMYKIAIPDNTKPKSYIKEEGRIMKFYEKCEKDGGEPSFAGIPYSVLTFKEAGKFYGVYDNVSEMTSEKGIAKGYNYYVEKKQLENKYEISNTYTGFRIFMEVIEK